MGDEGPAAAGLWAGFPAGARIAGYRLEERIGYGGMAAVFRAQDERLQRQVALKILSPALAADEGFRHRFVGESRSAAAVDDPHIIPVFEAGDADGVLFIAMRYVPGGDAGTLVHRLGPLPVARAVAIISAVASALDAAHAAGLVHRDVKPANMLVDTRPGRPDHVYLSDFGLTKGALSSASLTGAGHFLGTPTYSAPEQIQGHRVDARTDEYALACAAFVLLSGEPPFPRDEGMAVLYAQLSTPPPSLTSRRPDLPSAVDDVLLRALAKAPGDRYASCGEFAAALCAVFGLQRYESYESDVAIALHQRSLIDQQHRLGLDHADALASHASLAAAREAGRSDEAIAFHQRILIDQQDTLGSDHPDTLETRFSIAEEMAARGEHTAAENGFREVLAARQRTLGSDHPDTLATRFGLAREMAARGDHDRAEAEFLEVLAARQRAQGSDHPDTLATRFGLAREMAARGDHAGAEKAFRGVLAARQRTLGRDHPDTLATRHCIAQEMAAQGDHAGAEKVFRGVLTARQRTLGGDHPDTLATWFGIAQETAARGDHAAAEAEFRDVLPHLERRLGPDHPDTLIVRFSIAREMAARGDHAGAEAEFRDVLPHLERRLGPDHPDTLATRFGMAQEMAARGDHSGAESGFRDVLAARQRALGSDHPDTLIARFSIAQEMAARGDHAAAEAEFRGLLPHLRRRLGPDHPDTLATRFSIAREMAARGDHAGAEKEFRDVLPHLERHLGPDHPVMLILWFGLAREMAARGDHAGAETEFRDMLPHLRRTLGPEHPDTLAAAGWIDFIQGQKDDARLKPEARHRKAGGELRLRHLGVAPGDRRLAVRGLVLVDHALACRLVELPAGGAQRGLGRLRVPPVRGLAELTDGRAQR
jgi:eukaryotic-like serine/threonine-protein kinase